MDKMVLGNKERIHDMNELVFTSAAIIDLLSSIEELKDYQIGVTETLDGGLQVQVGDSIYVIESEAITEVETAQRVVEQIDEINTTAYEDMEEKYEMEVTDTVESGIIKELAKTLLIGGVVRMAAKTLKND